MVKRVARAKESIMIFLDTHIVVWMYQKTLHLLSPNAKKAIEENDLYISPMVLLELEYLYEIGRIKDDAKTIFNYLRQKIGLKVDKSGFTRIVEFACIEKWTRDPFDRIIVAHSSYRKAFLISKDENIARYYSKTVF